MYFIIEWWFVQQPGESSIIIPVNLKGPSGLKVQPSADKDLQDDQELQPLLRNLFLQQNLQVYGLPENENSI